MQEKRYYNKHRQLSFDELSIRHNITTGLIHYCLLIKLNKDSKLTATEGFCLKYRKKVVKYLGLGKKM